MPRWGSRSASVPGAVGLDRKTFIDLDNLIRDLEYNKKAFARGENILIHMLAKAHQGLAQQKSRGMVDPTGKAGRPFGIPVRRIKSAYYQGWRVRRIGKAAWMMYNDAREAYFIEFGINPRATGAVRRPILKMSAIATLRFVQRTRVIDRFAKSTIGGTRNQRGQYRSFSARMEGSQLLGVIGPEGSLPG